MSKPTTRTKQARLMALMKIIDAMTEDINERRRHVAALKRDALKLIRGSK